MNSGDSRLVGARGWWIRPLEVLASLGAVLVACRLSFRSWDLIPRLFHGSESYVLIPRQFLSGGMAFPNGRPPLYPLVNTWLLWMFGEGRLAWAAVVLQGACALGILLAVGPLVRRQGASPGWGLLATLCLCANQSFLVECLCCRETWLFALLVMGSAAGWIGILGGGEPAGLRWPVALGLLAALAWLTRPTGVALALVSGVVATVSTGGGCRAWVRRGSAFALALLLPIGAWLAYQAGTGQSPAIAGTADMNNLYKGNNDALPLIYPLLDVDELEPEYDRLVEVAMARGEDPDRALRSQVLEYVFSHPLEWTRVALRKVTAFLLPLDFPLGEGRVARAPTGSWSIRNYRSKIWKVHALGLAALPGVTCFLFLVAGWRRAPVFARAAASLVAVVLLIHVVTFAETRFRLPLDPVLAVCVGLMGGQLFRSWRPGPGGTASP